MKTGLFFGSFNPVHTGHMIIANFMLEHGPFDEVWMVVSPQNPHKLRKTLAKDYDRLHLVRLAIDDQPGLRASDVEFSLPKPSYTVHTLAHLRDTYPSHHFSLIMGGDNLMNFKRWKNYEAILDHHELHVYRRPGYDIGEMAEIARVIVYDAPLMHISASYIRDELVEGRSIRYLVPDPVWKYLSEQNLYRQLLHKNRE